MDEVKKLAEDHWKYVESVLLAHDVPGPYIDIAKFHYLSAFEHGFKHGVESMEDVK